MDSTPKQFYIDMIKDLNMVIDNKTNEVNETSEELIKVKNELAKKIKKFGAVCFQCKKCKKVYFNPKNMRLKTQCMPCYREYHRNRYKVKVGGKLRVKKTAEEKRLAINAAQRRRYRLKNNSTKLNAKYTHIKVMKELLDKYPHILLRPPNTN